MTTADPKLPSMARHRIERVYADDIDSYDDELMNYDADTDAGDGQC